MKTIATLLILFCGVTFSNAQEKKLPNKEETEKYLVKMITEGNGKEYAWGDNNRVSKNWYTSNGLFDYIVYYEGQDQFLCNTRYTGQQVTVTYDKYITYSTIDISKLINVEQTSKSASNATSLKVKLTFDGRFITENIGYKKFSITSVGQCVNDETYKIDFIYLYIPNEEGSFDRFKKALFHYKDLLIAEQKQKIADDPFAN
ncbi:hypothetical protein NU10_04190 [Flavobacterium dauae]|uniref:hypothetical protein n=1 Tax=Flavobacterium dauae TaxID=1563479 RepID=UPI00101B2D69|nr:hypothetical protein [Flavobacterium dauae]WLD24605.1 hypothetical protein NU10_04190 [Flavobacterium dauae]